MILLGLGGICVIGWGGSGNGKRFLEWIIFKFLSVVCNVFVRCILGLLVFKFLVLFVLGWFLKKVFFLFLSFFVSLFFKFMYMVLSGRGVILSSRILMLLWLWFDSFEGVICWRVIVKFWRVGEDGENCRVEGVRVEDWMIGIMDYVVLLGVVFGVYGVRVICRMFGVELWVLFV